MNVEHLPDFTPEARQRWESIPAHIRKELLANVWRVHCRESVIITNFSGTLKKADLLLVGKCAVCGSDVARMIEG